MIFFASPEQNHEYSNGHNLEPRDGPLISETVAQRVQAWVGIFLGLAGAAVIYLHVAAHGPR